MGDIRRPLSEGTERKNLNPPNPSTLRPPPPGGSGPKIAQAVVQDEKYEYQTITDHVLDRFNERCNDLGRKGWRLVSSWGEVNYYAATFMRRA